MPWRATAAARTASPGRGASAGRGVSAARPLLGGALSALVPLGPDELGNSALYATGLTTTASLTQSGALTPLQPAQLGTRYQVWEATTSYPLNPLAAGWVSGPPPHWSVYNPGGLTLTWSVVAQSYGNAVQVRIQNSTGVAQGMTIYTVPDADAPAAANGQPWTHSCSAAFVAGSMPSGGGFSVEYGVTELNSSRVYLATLAGADISALLTAALARISTTQTLNNASTAYADSIVNVNSIPNGADFTLQFWDPQFEQKAYATPSVAAGLAVGATGYNWNGPANASTSSRAVSSLTAPPSLLSNQRGAVIALLVPGWPYSAPPTASPRILTLGAAGNNYLSMYYRFADTAMALQESDGVASPYAKSGVQTFLANTQQFVYFGWDPTILECGTGGAIGTSVPRSAVLSTPNELRFGDQYAGPGVQMFDGTMGPLSLFKFPGRLSPAQVSFYFNHPEALQVQEAA